MGRAHPPAAQRSCQRAPQQSPWTRCLGGTCPVLGAHQTRGPLGLQEADLSGQAVWSQTQLGVSCWGCGLLGRRGARGGFLRSRWRGPGPAASEPHSPAVDGPGGSRAGRTPARCVCGSERWAGARLGGRRAGRRRLAEGGTEESGFRGDQRGVQASLRAPRIGQGGRGPCCVPHALFTSLVSSRLFRPLLLALGDVSCSLWPRGTLQATLCVTVLRGALPPAPQRARSPWSSPRLASFQASSLGEPLAQLAYVDPAIPLQTRFPGESPSPPGVPTGPQGPHGKDVLTEHQQRRAEARA